MTMGMTTTMTMTREKMTTMTASFPPASLDRSLLAEPEPEHRLWLAVADSSVNLAGVSWCPRHRRRQLCLYRPHSKTRWAWCSRVVLPRSGSIKEY